MLLSDVRSLRRHIRIYFLYMSLEITHYKKSTKTCWPQCSPVNMKITTYCMTTNLFASVLSKDSSYTAFLWQLSPLHHVPLRHNLIKIRLHCTTNYHLKCLKFCQQEQKHLHVVEEVGPKIYRIYIQYFFLKIIVFPFGPLLVRCLIDRSFKQNEPLQKYFILPVNVLSSDNSNCW